jgi:hypothetical protein
VNGPWDLAIIDDLGTTAKIFVSNVLSGTVVRLDVSVGLSNVTVSNPTEIADGYKFGLNASAFVVGPTGLAYDSVNDVLYVASTADNAIFAVPQAGSRTSPLPPPNPPTGAVIFQDNQLRGPLALALAPNGDLITSNGDAVNANVDQPSEIVEFTKDGLFIGQLSIDRAPGAAFGIAIVPVSANTARIALVNDDDNTIIVQTLNVGG